MYFLWCVCGGGGVQSYTFYAKGCILHNYKMYFKRVHFSSLGDMYPTSKSVTDFEFSTKIQRNYFKTIKT